MNSTDYLRGYTAPRAVVVGVLFVLAVFCRVPAVVLAIAVHVCDRTAEGLLGVIARIPPAPIRTVIHPTTGNRGRTRR